MRCLLASLPLLALLSCAPQGPGKRGEEDTDTGWLDCVLDEDLFADVRASLSAVQTVVSLKGPLPRSGKAFVMFEDANGTRRQILAAGEGSLDAQLLGLEAEQDYRYQLFLDEGDGRRSCSGERTGVTGSLPDDLPSLEVELLDAEAAFGGFILTTLITDGMAWPLILDEAGRPVWAVPLPLEGGHNITRSSMRPDRTAILAGVAAPTNPEFIGYILAFSLSGEEIARVPAAVGIDFLSLPDGKLAVLTRTERVFDSPLGEHQIWRGDSLVEMGPLGESPRTVWDVFTQFSPKDPRFARAWEPGAEWAHVNSLSYDQETDSFLMTAETPEGVMCIGHAMGDLQWMVDASGEDVSGKSLRPASETALEDMLTLPHSTRRLEDGILAFNRSERYDKSACAGVAELSIDEARGEVDLLDSFSGDRCNNVQFLGEAERLPNGNTQVLWSPLGRIEEVDPEGRVLLRIEVPADQEFTFFGFGERLDSLYTGGGWSGREGKRPY